MVSAKSVNKSHCIDIAPNRRIPSVEIDGDLGFVTTACRVKRPVKSDLSCDGSSEGSYCRVIESEGCIIDWCSEVCIIDLEYFWEIVGVSEIAGSLIGDRDVKFIIIIYGRSWRGKHYVVKSDPVGLRTQEPKVLYSHINKGIDIVSRNHSALGLLPCTNT